jgi:hypothetical protein
MLLMIINILVISNVGANARRSCIYLSVAESSNEKLHKAYATNVTPIIATVIHMNMSILYFLRNLNPHTRSMIPIRNIVGGSSVSIHILIVDNVIVSTLILLAKYLP